MPDETNHQLRCEHAGDDQRGVDDAKRYDAHAFDPVQGALQPDEAREGAKVEEERNADDDDVLPDSTLLSSHVFSDCTLRRFDFLVHLHPTLT